ncbi:MAG: anti-sigma factor [Candidatus Zixiibacteriota bacterium]
MKCERFDKLIYLSLDKRLDPAEEAELKAHLSQCRRCREKLSQLELLEGAARRLQIEEPAPEYWDTFSSRVREKIASRQEQSPATSLKKALQSAFSFSPWKVKIAAGLVSVLLVLVVGKLYMNYHGKEVVPSTPVVHKVEEPQVKIPAVEKPVIRPAQSEQRKDISPSDESLTKKKTATVGESRRKPVPEREVLTEQAQMSSPETTKGAITPPVPSPRAEGRAAVEAQSGISQTKSVGAGIEKSTEELQEKRLHVAPEKLQGTKELSQRAKTSAVQLKDITTSVRPSLNASLVRDHYVVNEKPVPRMEETDTLLQADELRGIIQTWKTHIKEEPDDSLNQEGYLQVATGYYLLSKLTQDTAIVSEGSNFVEEHLDQIKDPAIKSQLGERLERIKAQGKR